MTKPLHPNAKSGVAKVGVTSQELLQWVSGHALVPERAIALLDYIRALPIVDYHTHYDVAGLTLEQAWRYPSDIFLGRAPLCHTDSQIYRSLDHYLAQMMVKANVPDEVVFGVGAHSAEVEFRRFEALITSLRSAIGSDRYLWFCVALAEHFQVKMTPVSHSAQAIWDALAEKIRDQRFSPCGILKSLKVEEALSTDDPIEDLSLHSTIKTLTIRPTWRPDAALMLCDDKRYNFRAWVLRLGEVSGVGKIESLGQFLDALRIRLQYFVQHGCTVSDIGFSNFYPVVTDATIADSILRRFLAGEQISEAELRQWQGYILSRLIMLHGEFGLRQYLHQGAVRDSNSLRYAQFGSDIGGDTQGDRICKESFIQLFDYLYSQPAVAGREGNAIPPTVVFPASVQDYEWVVINAAPFCGGGEGRSSKIQLGPPWWWNDSRHYLRQTIQMLIRHDGLFDWIGMTSDARSIPSVGARHLVFRAVLAAELVDAPMIRELDDEALFELAGDVCYFNAKRWVAGRSQPSSNLD